MLQAQHNDCFTPRAENVYIPGAHPNQQWRADQRVNVTIKDVARAANVSVATVSRALNGHHNVAEAVRLRVIRVAGELR